MLVIKETQRNEACCSYWCSTRDKKNPLVTLWSNMCSLNTEYFQILESNWWYRPGKSDEKNLRSGTLSREYKWLHTVQNISQTNVAAESIERDLFLEKGTSANTGTIALTSNTVPLWLPPQRATSHQQALGHWWLAQKPGHDPLHKYVICCIELH